MLYFFLSEVAKEIFLSTSTFVHKRLPLLTFTLCLIVHLIQFFIQILFIFIIICFIIIYIL
jgi:hypothetical protein